MVAFFQASYASRPTSCPQLLTSPTALFVTHESSCLTVFEFIIHALTHLTNTTSPFSHLSRVFLLCQVAWSRYSAFLMCVKIKKLRVLTWVRVSHSVHTCVMYVCEICMPKLFELPEVSYPRKLVFHTSASDAILCRVLKKRKKKPTRSSYAGQVCHWAF